MTIIQTEILDEDPTKIEIQALMPTIVAGILFTTIICYTRCQYVIFTPSQKAVPLMPLSATNIWQLLVISMDYPGCKKMHWDSLYSRHHGICLVFVYGVSHYDSVLLQSLCMCSGLRYIRVRVIHQLFSVVHEFSSLTAHTSHPKDFVFGHGCFSVLFINEQS